jgi:UDP-N-acetyl-D-galactosamine dehydrogenase
VRETRTVCVVGLGYVGLPLALAFAEEGVPVIGFDVDGGKVESLSAGRDPTGHAGDDAVAGSEVSFSIDPAAIGSADYVVVAVPTPVDDGNNPNLAHVEAAAETIGEQMTPGTTVVLESTVFPGATEEVLVPALEAASGFALGEEFHVGYAPERAAPGETGRGVRDVVRVVSGDTDAVRDELAALYGHVVDAGTYPAPSIRTAEAAKVIENVQRDVNIALANELAVICDHLDLRTRDVLDAAASKWNFHDEYRPGLVGGHCIPVDPLYLVHRSEHEGFSPKLVLQAREVNEYMPKHAAEVTLKGLNRCGKVLRESRVLVLGLSYKANVGDIRTSEVRGLLAELREYGVDVVGHDPHVDPGAAREAFGVPLADTPSPDGYDAAVVATGHDAFRELAPADFADGLSAEPLLVDLPGLFDRATVEAAGVRYAEL